jgi:hypothetical protein
VSSNFGESHLSAGIEIFQHIGLSIFITKTLPDITTGRLLFYARADDRLIVEYSQKKNTSETKNKLLELFFKSSKHQSFAWHQN